MVDRTVRGHTGSRLAGAAYVPGDKSIAHRVLLLGAMARGTTFAKGVPKGDDLNATLSCLRGLGVRCEQSRDAVSVVGIGRNRFSVPTAPLDCAGSATSFRLLLGAIAAKGQRATLTGDASLRRRPMDRVIEPLGRMGATFDAMEGNRYPPVTIVSPDSLKSIEYELPVASAQVKSAIIMAGLSAGPDRTVIRGAIGSRDHTERMIPRMGGKVVVTRDSIVVEKSDLEAIAVTVPGDPSSAAFFAAAAAVMRNSQVTIRSVSTNPTRTGFFDALTWMGADLKVEEVDDAGPEPYGDVTVKWAPLKGITIDADAVPYLVDEVPLLLMVGAFAEGETLIKGIGELRVKETDRVSAAVEGLSGLGAVVEAGEDWVRVEGGHPLKGGVVDSCGDHRMAMMFTIAAHAIASDSVIRGVQCESKSFPGFFEQFSSLIQ